jgi:hypothetical protein
MVMRWFNKRSRREREIYICSSRLGLRVTINDYIDYRRGYQGLPSITIGDNHMQSTACCSKAGGPTPRVFVRVRAPLIAIA